MKRAPMSPDVLCLYLKAFIVCFMEYFGNECVFVLYVGGAVWGAYCAGGQWSFCVGFCLAEAAVLVCLFIYYCFI